MPISTAPSAMPWYKSKIIVGALISIVAKILVASGVATNFTPEDSDNLANLIVMIIGGIGDAIAIGARLTQKAAPTITAATTTP